MEVITIPQRRRRMLLEDRDELKPEVMGGRGFLVKIDFSEGTPIDVHFQVWRSLDEAVQHQIEMVFLPGRGGPGMRSSGPRSAE